MAKDPLLGITLLSYSLGMLTIIAHTHVHTRAYTSVNDKPMNLFLRASLMKEPRPWALLRSLRARKEAQTEFIGKQEEVQGKDSGCGKKSRTI